MTPDWVGMAVVLAATAIFLIVSFVVAGFKNGDQK